MDKDENARTIRTASRALAATLLLLLSGCVFFMKHTPRGACSNDLGSPVRNFCVVAPGALWRGEYPTPTDATWLVEHRVGSIISLQLNDRRAFERVMLPSQFTQTVQYFQVPGFSPLQMVSPTRVDKHVALFLAIVKAAPKPVYVHCRAGIDRTGVVAAAYRVIVEGTAAEKAIAEMGKFHSPWQGIDAHYIRGLTPDRQSQILHEVAGWEARLRPSAQIDCRDGHCTYRRNDVDPTVKASRIPGGS